MGLNMQNLWCGGPVCGSPPCTRACSCSNLIAGAACVLWPYTHSHANI